MSSIGIAYSPQAGGSYNVLVDLFTGAEVARTYEQTAQFQRGLSGQQLISGRPGRQKFIWAISAVLDNAEAKKVDDMFKAWDEDRATGIAAAVGVTDETLFDTLTTNAIFTTPPTYIKTGPHHFTVSFGLTEV